MNVLNNMSWSPVQYQASAFLAKLVGEQMVARLDLMTIKPKTIIDLGCGLADASLLLRERYPEAVVVGVDLSEAMLGYAQQVNPLVSLACADALRLPLKDHSVDMVFANFILSWQSDFNAFLAECKRVLAPEGLLMLNAIGPDTLSEWRVDVKNEDIPCFMDMHNLGDLLLQTGFVDPVVDVNDYTATYQDKNRFVTELRDSGFWFPSDANAGLASLATAETVEWYTEVSFAHAFAPTPTNEVSMSADGMARVPVSHLRQQLRNRGR